MRRLKGLLTGTLGLAALAVFVLAVVLLFGGLSRRGTASTVTPPTTPTRPATPTVVPTRITPPPMQTPTSPASPLPTPTPPRATPSPPVPWPTAPPYTPPPDWTNVTLDRIRFGEPTVVLTHTNLIKVIEWLPDSRRLLLELGTGEFPLTNRIVTLDVITGEMVEYGRRTSRDIAPLWVEQAQGVVFDFWISDSPPELRFGRAMGQVRTLDQADARPTVHRPSGRLLYVPVGATLRAREVASGQAVPPPFQAELLPFGKLRADPQGRWLISLWGRGGPWGPGGLHLADMSRRTVRQIDLRDPAQPFINWWPFDAVWSPDGQQAALVLAQGENLVLASKLAILDPETGRWRWLDLPPQFVTEVDWAPDGRIVILMGSDLVYGSSFANDSVWFVDTATGEYRNLNLLPPQTSLGWGWNLAWSPDGRYVAWIRAIPGEGGLAISPITLQR